MNPNNLPDPSELARNVRVTAPLKKRREHQSNIWFFDSPKNDKRLTIHTDLAFMHFVTLEGDPSVLCYVPRPEPSVVILDTVRTDIKVDAHVHRVDGTVEWWDFKRSDHPPRTKSRRPAEATMGPVHAAAESAGAIYRVLTDAELTGQEIFFDNWLTLCAAINRCRNHFLGTEADLFLARLHLQQSVMLGHLLTIPGIDSAYMLAVVGLALQKGSAQANLTGELLGRATSISRRDHEIE